MEEGLGRWWRLGDRKGHGDEDGDVNDQAVTAVHPFHHYKVRQREVSSSQSQTSQYPTSSTLQTTPHPNLITMSTVLITGLNGFVAVHAAVVYLKNGWSVRGTVRSQDKADKVKALSAFKDYPGKVEVVIIKDLIEGDYTEALKGVDAVSISPLETFIVSIADLCRSHTAPRHGTSRASLGLRTETQRSKAQPTSSSKPPRCLPSRLSV